MIRMQCIKRSTSAAAYIRISAVCPLTQQAIKAVHKPRQQACQGRKQACLRGVGRVCRGKPDRHAPQHATCPNRYKGTSLRHTTQSR